MARESRVQFYRVEHDKLGWTARGMNSKGKHVNYIYLGREGTRDEVRRVARRHWPKAKERA